MATNIKHIPKVSDELEAMDRARNIAQRIAAVMGEVDYVQKEKKQGMSYTVVSHDKVTALVRPALHKHGVICYPRDLTVSQNGNRTEAVFNVRFENVDNRDDYIDVATFGYGVDNQDKGPGKAISYGVKYAYLKCLGLETGDDPDEVQDNRADYVAEPEKSTFGDPTTPRLAGDMSDSALRGFIKTLTHNLNGVGSVQDLDELLELEETKAAVEQCQRRYPHWWAGRKDQPDGFRPLKRIIEETRAGLAALETQ